MDKERIIQLHNKPEDLIDFIHHLSEAVAEDDPNKKDILEALEDIGGLLEIVVHCMTVVESSEERKPVRKPSAGRKKPVS